MSAAVAGFVVGALGWIGLLLMIAGVMEMIREAHRERERTIQRMIKRHVTPR